MSMSNAQLKRDLIVEAETLLAHVGHLWVGGVDLDELVSAVEALYRAFPGLKAEPGDFAPNQRESWPR